MLPVHRLALRLCLQRFHSTAPVPVLDMARAAEDFNSELHSMFGGPPSSTSPRGTSEATALSEAYTMNQSLVTQQQHLQLNQAPLLVQQEAAVEVRREGTGTQSLPAIHIHVPAGQVTPLSISITIRVEK
jgi:hypothetical protein